MKFSEDLIAPHVDSRDLHCRWLCVREQNSRLFRDAPQTRFRDLVGSRHSGRDCAYAQNRYVQTVVGDGNDTTKFRYRRANTIKAAKQATVYDADDEGRMSVSASLVRGCGLYLRAVAKSVPKGAIARVNRLFSGRWHRFEDNSSDSVRLRDCRR